jgi:gamma-glutamylcyclotransferase (GGCT)/AIG2-like uncharacterized protein YtfP
VTNRNDLVIVRSILADSEPEPRRGGIHLFVYGSLVDPRRLDEVLGYRFDGERLSAHLADHERVSVDGFEWPFIVPSPGHTVVGVLIMDLTARELDILDRYEEVHLGFYSRASVDVEAWGCGPRPVSVAAQAYVAGSSLARLIALSAAHTTRSTTT